VKVVTVKALISICCWISVLMHRNFTICGRWYYNQFIINQYKTDVFVSYRHTYFICFSLLSILVFNTISISDDVYVVKRNMTGAPEFTADFEWGWCCSTFRFLWRIAGRVM
jgi:hypothetical protein